MRSHSLSLRQRVRFSVPSLCLDPSSSDAQGTLRENHKDSSRRASSHVIPDFIASESGHLTQNHIVVSSRSPRTYGTQFSSSVAGIRSGLVNTPVKVIFHCSSINILDNIPIVLSPAGSYSRASRCAPWLTKSAVFPLSEGDSEFKTGRTFAGNRKQDYATWFFNVGYCKVPYKFHLIFLTSDEETWVEC